MISGAYELFGCNTADLFVISVDYGNTNAQCIQFDQTYGIEFPCISGIEGGGNAINNTYGINAYPTYILIAPNHEIVEQDMWPISSVQTFVTYFQNNGLQQAECGAPLTAAFSANDYEACQGAAIQFTDESVGTITSWEWVFEGGNPATSLVQNPLVTYEAAGDFDVTLTVSDGVNSNTITNSDLIKIFPLPEVSLMPFDTICYEWPAFELTGGIPGGGTYSGPGVENGWFNPSVAGIGEHVILYSFTDANGCENSDEQTAIVTSCVGISENDESNFSIYPNPSSDQVIIKTRTINDFAVSISNPMGEVVFRGIVPAGKSLLVNDLTPGIYLVQLSHQNTSFFSKLIITQH